MSNSPSPNNQIQWIATSSPDKTVPVAATPNLQETMCMLQMMSSEGPLAKFSNKESVMSGISIPGLSTIFGGGNITRRIVWSVVVVTALLVATIQVKDRVEFYISTPVTVNVRVTMNESLRFPVLTICNKNLFNMSQVRLLSQEMNSANRFIGTDRSHKEFSKSVNLDSWTVSQLVGFRGMNAKKLWDILAHDPNKIIDECWFGRNISCNQIGHWEPVHTYMGVCYSFILNENTVKTTGMFNNLYIKLKDTEKELYLAGKGGERGWKMLIHNPLDSPVIDIRTHGSTLDQGWGKDIRIYLRQFRTLNVWKRPCSMEGNYSRCIEQCFVVAAASRMTCRLPFMGEESGNLSYCKTPSSYLANIEIIEKLLFHGHWTTNNCTHCKRQCHQDIYVAYTEMTQMKSDELSKLRLFFQDFTFDEIEESADYGAVSLLCDIGGSLGFLLGFSVLTIFEIVDAIVQACLTTSKRVVKKCRGR